MILAITGTPGTGKTTIAEILENNGFHVVHLGELVVEKKFVDGYDEERDTYIIDVEKLDDYISKTYGNYETLIILEGHLSHLLTNVDYIIILRCHPKTLWKRLQSKNWKKEKIRENVEAEILDIILCEAVEKHNEDKLFEIDTTSLQPEEAAAIIIKLIESGFKRDEKLSIGRIDWSEEILDWWKGVDGSRCP